MNNKSNTECGIIRPTNAFTWDHIHYLEVSYQYPVKGTLLIFKSEVLVVSRSHQNI